MASRKGSKGQGVKAETPPAAGPATPPVAEPELVDAVPVDEPPRPSAPSARTAPAVVEGEVVAPKRGRKPKARPVKPAAPATASEDDAETPESEGADSEQALDELVEAEAAAEPDVDVEALPEVPAAKVTALGRRDVLSAYMAEVHQHPLLTREEEVDLARRYRDAGDVKAAYRLVAANLRLVVKLAHEYHRNPLSLLDLVQEGNIGLMQAVKKFDPERGVKLSSYAAWWIRAYILRYIMDNWKMVKLGTTEAQRKLFFKLRQEQDRLMAQGFEVTPKLLAERLNVSEQDVIDMDRRLGQDELSLDAPLGHEDDAPTRADRLIASGATSADDALGNEQLKALFREKLAAFAQGLNAKEKVLFEKRLIADEPMTLQDIGALWGVSRERARQIEAALVERMREYMREHIPDFDLVKETEE